MTNPMYPPYPSPYPMQPGQPQQFQAQPQYPPQQMQQPVYPQPQNPPQPQPWAPPQAQPQPMAMPPAAGAVPAYYIPDEQQVLAGYQAARESVARAMGGMRAAFLKFLGPRGEPKWGQSVPIGYVANLPVYILPAPQPKPGQSPVGIYLESNSHFWKSAAHPQGSMIQCPGPGKCLVCAAREAGLAHPDPNVQKRAKDFARVRTQYLYQVVMLQYPQAHIGQDGQMRPQILGAGKRLHTAIGDLIQNRGIARIVDPMSGRPIMLKKAKTGHEEREVEYGALDLEPQPLPPMFYPCLQNLYDLREFVKEPATADMMKAIQEMGLPSPGMPQQAAFSAAPVAPWGNPYQQQQFQPQAQQPQQFQGFQPPQQFAPMGPPAIPGYQPPGDPYEFPPRDAAMMPPQPPPPMGPMGFTVPAAPAQIAPAYFQQTPPPVSSTVPPPVTSAPQVQTMYQMQPGSPGQPQVAQPQPTQQQQPVPQGALPPAPAMPQAAPMMLSASDTPHQITVPVPPGSLSLGRDRCFGKPNPADQWCQQCPDWIKQQCNGQAGAQPVAAAPVDAKLQALQGQLMGQV